MKYLSIARNRRTLGYLHPPYSDFARRGARPRCDPHWLGLGDSRGRKEASGRENQERQVYQEARRKRKMSRIMSQRKTFCRTSKVLLPLARLILQSE